MGVLVPVSPKGVMDRRIFVIADKCGLNPLAKVWDQADWAQNIKGNFEFFKEGYSFLNGRNHLSYIQG